VEPPGVPVLTGDDVRRLVYEHYEKRIRPNRDLLE
jgi:hypothetical protein